jgi:thiol-disulfide isomerase/thioredoxin
MAKTPSSMIPLGSELPKFNLPDAISDEYVSDEKVILQNGLLVLFICNHCPFVIHVENEIRKLGQELPAQGVVAISSNDIIKYPQDAPVEMKKKDYSFPYLFDESQEAATAFDAACTPDIFLYDGSRKLVYRGQLDSSRPGSDIPVTGEDLRRAVSDLIGRQGS